MKPAIFAGYFKRRRGKPNRSPGQCIELCRRAGFDCIDYSPDFTAESWETETKEAAEAAEKLGVQIFQCHAPYNFYKKASPEVFSAQLKRATEGARMLGAQNLVYHFDEYHPYPISAFSVKRGLKEAYDVLAPHIENTLKYGICAALENTFEDKQPPQRAHLCATIEELCEAIGMFNDPRVTCCWDFGHARLAFGDRQADMIRQMGKCISCTHLHDNYYGKDLHLMPFMGDMNWEELIGALRDTGYDGPLAFECGYGCLPDELIQPYANLCFGAMRHLCDLADKA